MHKILVLENAPGFGGALVSLKYFLENVDPMKYEFHVFINYCQNYIVPGKAVRDVKIVERKRVYGKDRFFEKVFGKVLGNKAGYLAYVLDYLTFCRFYVHQIVKYVKKNKIDLLYLNNWPLINDAGIYAAKKLHIPCVQHVRGLDYTGRLIRKLLSDASHIIAVSSYLRNKMVDMGIEKNKISVVYDALDFNSFCQCDGDSFKEELGLKDKGPLIGMVGCLVEWKGHEVFLDACKKVFKNHPAFGIIVGDVPDSNSELKKKLIDLTFKLGLKDRIFFLGHIRRVQDAMAACDVLVHASTIPEPFGRVIIEGMALGKPVIATSHGGPVEIIEDGKDGFLVPPRDSQALAEKILYLLQNPHIGNMIGKNARSKILKNFSIQNHADKIMEIINNCLV